MTSPIPGLGPIPDDPDETSEETTSAFDPGEPDPDLPDPDSINDWIAQAFTESLQKWGTYIETLPENTREKIAAQPRQFYYDSGDFLTTLIGAALMYHSQQLIADHDSVRPGLTAEMARLGDILLNGGPDEVEMGDVYSEWLDDAMIFTDDGRIEFSEKSPEVEAEEAEYDAALAAAEAERVKALHAAVDLLDALWH